MAVSTFNKHFHPPGPVAAAWINDDTTEIPIIMGPTGSGKTTAAVFKGVRFIARHMPVCLDGAIRGRLTVIRDNYRRLAQTALKSWKLFFPEDFPDSDYSGGQDRPVQHLLRFDGQRDGKLVQLEIEVDFFAIGDLSIEEMLKSYETSVGWMNECDLLNERVPSVLFSRTGRYPSPTMFSQELQERILAGTYNIPRQVYGDCNPPDVGHWVKRLCVDEKTKKEGFRLYRQPGGLSPRAENRLGKSLAAYEADARTMDAYDKKRFVDGEFGFARDGIPVYVNEFQELVHVAPSTIRVDRNLPLTLSFDAGGSPAGTVLQKMPSGRINHLAEIVSDPGTGAARFSEKVVALLAEERFRGVPVGLCFGDPAAFYGADKVNGELAWMETVARAIGHNIVPSETNEPGIRTDAVKIMLQRRIDGEEAFQIDPSCVVTIAGFAAYYKLGKDSKGNVTNDARPVKNHPWSDVHDALQYGVLGINGRAGVIEEAARAGRPGNVIPARFGSPRPTSERGFNVWDA